MRLLARSSRRYLTRHPLRLLLALGGVALGVSVVVAIDLVNASALRAFRLSTEAVAGRATHQITAGSTGLDEKLLTRLVMLPASGGLPPMAPIIEDVVILPAGAGRGRPRSLRMLGVDVLSEAPFRDFLGSGVAGLAQGLGGVSRVLTEPGAVVMARPAAEELGLQVGGRFSVEVGTATRELLLLALIEPRDETTRAALSNLILADIATAQETLGIVGRLTRIETIVDRGTENEATLALLRGALPPDAVLEPTAARAGALDTMTRAFRLNLRALSSLALLCGALLIYNTMSFSVIERRSLFGLLRSIGASRREIFALVLGEAAAIGLVGSALGSAAGVVLGRGLVGLVTQTINDLYFVLSVREAAPASGSILRGLAVGLIVAVLAAAAPAREAMAVDPRAAIARSVLERSARRSSRRAFRFGLGLLVIGALVLWIDARSLPLAFLGLFAVLAGAALLVPESTAALGRTIGRWAGPSTRWRFAARGLVASLSRTGVAVAALTLAVATAIGVDLMIGSFRGAVETWLGGTLAADFYIAPPHRMATAAQLALTPDLVDEVRALPGVERVHTLRTVVFERAGKDPTRVSGIDLGRRGFDAFDLGSTDADRQTAAWSAWQAGAALVSEPFAYRRRLRVGDAVELETTSGRLRAPIAGVFRDYGSEQGVVVLADSFFRRLWPEAPVAALSVFAASGADGAQLERALRALERSDRQILVESSRALREGSMKIFDRTFRVTGVLRLLTLLVAVLGVLAALTALEFERGREFGILRATGWTPGDVAGLVMRETGLLGLAAGLFAMPLGTVLSAILVYVINRRSFGWTMELTMGSKPFVTALVLALIAALAAGIYPAWRSARTVVAEALRSE